MAVDIAVRLREETRHEHARIEASLLATGFLVDRARYLDFLRRTWGWLAVVEPRLHANAAVSAALSDLPERRKLPWLAADLAAMGESREAVDAIELAPPQPELRGPAALGWLYVLEGSTLGGRVIARKLSERLGICAKTGGRYVAGYAEHTPLRWAACRAAIAQAVAENGKHDEVVEGARTAFDRMREWYERGAAARRRVSGAAWAGRSPR